MSERSEKRFIAFIDFLREFILELNERSKEGSVLLVEGQRDARAMRDLGYSGSIVTISSLGLEEGRSRLLNAKEVIILTDLDREGRELAAKYTRLLTHEGSVVSLEYRKKLLIESKGMFRQIQNLARFSNILGYRGEKSKSLY